MDLLDPMVTLYLIFWETTRLFPRESNTIYILYVVYEGSEFSILTNIHYLNFLF